MATIVFGMMQSLDGYVAGVEGELEPPLHSPGPGIALFRYWIDCPRRAKVDPVPPRLGEPT